ncbi:DNA replication and repair protein RecN [Jatrophihabitans sp. GAS493]|uniref:DNA repair protein RecN n=1 Tax=Jatrophihabitans sp. GAS493 TaxID=1907575 RepID=UPI000BB71792|nr:DNA repair protein RecN [Jatrophihabitans sp. GAS493]SOD73794.1 DNA replication and repair protein RecN [Jatrophihabitans sp. GAS493]
MLEEIRISSLGVIQDAVLPLTPGLTVVTGETGAGKTMVVTGLSLLFGGRADPARVRTGATEASVDGRVLLERSRPRMAEVAARVADAGGAVEIEEPPGDGADVLLLRRIVNGNGRSRAYVGGAPAPASVLAELGESLLVMHGQSDQLRLTRPAEQRAVLDRFAGVELEEYAVAFTEWRDADRVLQERTSRAREMQREAELLAHGVAEIDAAELIPGEDVELNEAAKRLSHADALRLAALGAHTALRGGDESTGDAPTDVASLLDSVVRQLGAVVGADRELDELASRARDLSAVADDLAHELSAYVDRIDADPEQLAQIETRRAVIAALIRRYGDDLDAVLSWAEDARKQLTDLDVSDEAMAALAEKRDRSAQRAAKLAGTISTTRRVAAERLAAAVTDELHGLAMASAQLEITVQSRPAASSDLVLVVDGVGCAASIDGVDDVQILLRPHPDAPSVPLQRGASGGELSRVMLALEVCLAGADPVATMVFDEVDSGVGGRAAVEVGRRLARLARTHQVIVVTHLPQVAAFGQNHVVVDKAATESVTASDLRVVRGEDRVVELARMLGGRDTDAARIHATEMIAEADAESSPPPRRRKAAGQRRT